MRYLSIFLLLFSANLFAVDPPPEPVCATKGPEVTEYDSLIPQVQKACINSNTETNKRIFVTVGAVLIAGVHPGTKYRCDQNCTCPPPSTYNITVSATGIPSASCVNNSGSTPGEDSCEESEKVFDPSTGAMVCPGSGDGSSSASSNTCVVPGDYDGDCQPDNASSAASSGGPSSAAPSSASGSSSGNDGGGDGGSGSSSGSGSGGDGGSGSGPGTGGGSGPGTGTGTTPGGSSAGSNTSSGSNNSWTPNSGYGNWIPVSEGSNCPNKYEDANGQWWCAGSTGTGSSSGAGQCDPTSKDYLSCISQQQTPSSGGSGSSACTIDSPNYAECSGKVADSEGQLQQLGDKFSEDIDTQKDDYEQALDDDLEAFTRDGVSFKNEPNILKSALISFLPVSTPCNPPPLQILGRTYQLDCQHFNTFKQAFGWFLAVITAWGIWQMAIRPVDR